MSHQKRKRSPASAQAAKSATTSNSQPTSKSTERSDSRSPSRRRRSGGSGRGKSGDQPASADPRSGADRPRDQRRPEKPRRSAPSAEEPVKVTASVPDPALPLRDRLLLAVREQPLDHAELVELLDLPPSQSRILRDLLATMEKSGEVARIRKDRFIIPREADLVTGEIQIHPSGTAHILSEIKGEPDLFISAENTWTAMHGDRVVARIQTDSRPSRGRDRGGEAKREGRVIRILTRANETIVGTLQKSKNFFYVVADDPRFVHNLYVPAPTKDVPAEIGDKVVAHLEDWSSRHVNPEGRLVEVLGRTGAPGVDILSIIRKHRLPEKFPDDVVREAQEIAPEVPAHEAAQREDLRGRMIITIDPDDSKDFDDAFEVQPTADGWSVSVHIADVSHYVHPNSKLDREAYSRGNSVYLADRVIPMLPEALSNGICSLKPGVDRMAFSAFAEISRSGKVTSSRFARTVIRSASRLTYKQAFTLLQSPPADPVGERVHAAWDLASVLRKLRFQHGSLDLDFPEIKVWLDANGKPERLERIENDISHQLVEELMLLANELVARELKLNRQPTVYRIHEDPEPDRLAEFREIAMSYGLRPGDLTKREEIGKLLASVKGKPYEHAVTIGLLKSLKRASYSTEPLGHYGLAKKDYTHFTSPIRRYADLVVHRAMERHLGLAKSGPSSAELAPLAEHVSTTERTATDAERESTKLKKLEFFQQQISDREGQSFPARIVDVRNYGLLVELPDFLLSGLVHVSTLADDFYVHEPAKARFIGRKTKKTYQTGQLIDVVVARVDMFKQQVDFQPVSS